MKIAFDMDEVIYPFLDTFLKFYNPKHRTNWKKEDFFCYEFPKVMGVPLEEIIEDLECFYKTKEFYEAAPIQGAKEGIYELSKNNDLYLISGRVDHLKEKTADYLKRNFDDSFKGVYLSDFHPYENMQLNPKQKICKELGIEIMLEDIPIYAIRCYRECNIPVIVPKQPWNKDTDFSMTKCVLVEGWKETMEAIRGYN